MRQDRSPGSCHLSMAGPAEPGQESGAAWVSTAISQVWEAPSRSLETPAFPVDRGSVVYQRDASVDSRQ
jgi:hypothetical protein